MLKIKNVEPKKFQLFIDKFQNNKKKNESFIMKHKKLNFKFHPNISHNISHSLIKKRFDFSMDPNLKIQKNHPGYLYYKESLSMNRSNKINNMKKLDNIQMKISNLMSYKKKLYRNLCLSRNIIDNINCPKIIKNYSFSPFNCSSLFLNKRIFGDNISCTNKNLSKSIYNISDSDKKIQKPNLNFTLNNSLNSGNNNSHKTIFQEKITKENKMKYSCENIFKNLNIRKTNFLTQLKDIHFHSENINGNKRNRKIIHFL